MDQDYLISENSEHDDSDYKDEGVELDNQRSSSDNRRLDCFV